MNSSPPSPEIDRLAELTRRPHYFARTNEVILRLTAAPDSAAAVDLLGEAVARMGGDVATWCSFVHEGGLASMRLMLACDPRWGIEYERHGWYAHDPWLAHARTAADPIVGQTLVLATQSERDMVRSAEAFGFSSTVIVPVPAGEGLSRVGMLCVGSATPRFFESDGYPCFRIAARSLASELQAWWLRRMRDELQLAWEVNAEELQLLGWERQGLRSKAIAAKLGTSEDSIDCRFKRLNARLGVAGRKAAAQLAAEYGLI